MAELGVRVKGDYEEEVKAGVMVMPQRVENVA
jgi:hypothetical protein